MTTKTKSTAVTVRSKPAERTKPTLAQVAELAVWQLVPTKRRILAALPAPIIFDPENKKHREAFASFLVNGKWPEGIRFVDEWPHTSAVTTIQTKLMHYALRKELMGVTAAKVALEKASSPAVKKAVTPTTSKD